MHFIAATAVTLWAVLSSVPAITAVPTPTSSDVAKATSSALTTFKDGFADSDIKSNQFSIVMSDTSASWVPDTYQLVITTASGSTTPSNFQSNTKDWQTFPSPHLPNGWTVDILVGEHFGAYDDSANGMKIHYADQEFIVSSDTRCSHWSHDSAGVVLPTGDACAILSHSKGLWACEKDPRDAVLDTSKSQRLVHRTHIERSFQHSWREWSKPV